MENWKAVAFLLAAGQGFMLSLALLVRGIFQRSSLFLGLILLVLALELLNAWAMQVQYHSLPDALPFWNVQSYGQLPISLWFFVQLTTNPVYALPKRFWLAYLPVLLEITIRSFWQLYWRFVDRNISSLLTFRSWYVWTEILPIVGMGVVLWIYGRRLIQLRNYDKKQSVPVTLADLLKQYGLFGSLLALTLLWGAGVLLTWPVFKEIEWLLTGLLFGIGYVGYLDPTIFTVSAVPRVTDKPDFACYDDQAEYARLQSAFNPEGLYRQPKLTVDEVATHLNLPARYVSYLINKYAGVNFNGFVNQYRVEEVIRKLADPKQQHKTILALALEAGFNSKSTFNQVFKQQTGKSPSQYLLLPKL